MLSVSIVAGVFRGAGRPGEVCGPHAGPERLPAGQRPQQGHPVLCRDWTVPQDRPLRQEGKSSPHHTHFYVLEYFVY